TRHRETVTKKLADFYDPTVAALQNRPGGTGLKDGLAKVLESVRTAEQAIVSIRVAEAKAPGGGGDSEARAKRLLDAFATRTATELTNVSPRQIVLPPGVVVNPPPPPIGEQLLAFVEAPADAPAAHFDIRYWFEPVEDGSFKVVCRVEVRTSIDEQPVGSAD